MASSTDIVKHQLVYWAQITAAGAFTVQNGPGLLTIVLAASVYTITMPANFTIPVNRRFIKVQAIPTVAAPNLIAGYDEAASLVNTVVIDGWDSLAAAGVGAAANCAFQIEISRVEMLP
jgi:hypothetical protein